MIFCFYAKEEERLYYEIESFLEDFSRQNPEIKIYKISEEEIEEILIKLKINNLFGEKFFYYCPLIEISDEKKGFLDQLMKIYEKKEMAHFFLFGILKEITHPLFNRLKENQRFHFFETMKFDKEWSLFSDNIINEILKKNNKTISYEARIILKERCKWEPIRLKKELEKICLYVEKEKIETEIIKKMCDEESSEAYGLKKSIEKKDPKHYLEQAKKLLKEGEPPILIFSILSKEIKFLIILKGLLKKEDTILSREQFIQQVFPYLKEKTKNISLLEENYASRFKNPNALYYSYEALSKYELEELIDLQKKINHYNLNIREGYDPEDLIYNFGFEIYKETKRDKRWK